MKETKNTHSMTKFITVTVAKESDESLQQDLPVLLNTHYIIKVTDSTEDEYGKCAIALATGEFLFVLESRQELEGKIG